MAFICLKPSGSCGKCIHYRYDEDKSRNACFAQIDNENKTNLNEPVLKDIEHIYENTDI